MGSDETPGIVEILLCIFCSGIGCILGIVYMVQGKPKGWKMVLISFIVAVIGGIIRVALSSQQ